MAVVQSRKYVKLDIDSFMFARDMNKTKRHARAEWASRPDRLTILPVTSIRYSSQPRLALNRALNGKRDKSPCSLTYKEY